MSGPIPRIIRINNPKLKLFNILYYSFINWNKSKLSLILQKAVRKNIPFSEAMPCCPQLIGEKVENLILPKANVASRVA
ncbi:hypothetical protein [Pontibacter ummariensis]|uniref:hypothetical protein n=1 Tax=Pontibacter ummariensis TaxID=1610492 RepID=UPI000B78AE06|nr:hypothetical protein [Pontibacter ummariensis]